MTTGEETTIEAKHQVETGTEHDTATGKEVETEHEGDGEPDGEGEHQGRREARYRRQLRDAEAERDGLATRVEAMQRVEVERVAGAKLAVPAGLWASGVSVADLLDESGDIDAAKVDAAVDAAVESLGLATKPRGNVSPKEGASHVNMASRRGLEAMFGPD